MLAKGKFLESYQLERNPKVYHNTRRQQVTAQTVAVPNTTHRKSGRRRCGKSFEEDGNSFQRSRLVRSTGASGPGGGAMSCSHQGNSETCAPLMSALCGSLAEDVQTPTGLPVPCCRLMLFHWYLSPLNGYGLRCRLLLSVLRNTHNSKCQQIQLYHNDISRIRNSY